MNQDEWFEGIEAAREYAESAKKSTMKYRTNSPFCSRSSSGSDGPDLRKDVEFDNHGRTAILTVGSM